MDYTVPDHGTSVTLPALPEQPRIDQYRNWSPGSHWKQSRNSFKSEQVALNVWLSLVSRAASPSPSDWISRFCREPGLKEHLLLGSSGTQTTERLRLWHAPYPWENEHLRDVTSFHQDGPGVLWNKHWCPGDWIIAIQEILIANIKISQNSFSQELASLSHRYF